MGKQRRSVHAERAIPAGDDAALASTLEYFARPAVSERRLTHLDTGLVHVQGKFHPGLGRDHQLWTGVEFLAHLVPHIQHRFECRIHTYGALSTSVRRRLGWIGTRPAIILAGEEAEHRAQGSTESTECATERSPCPPDLRGATDGAHVSSESTASHAESHAVFRPAPASGSAASSPATPESDPQTRPDDEPDPFTRARKRRWAELIRHVWLDDPELCERCGARMRIARVRTSPRDDDAIRRELEARGEWAPPWARAPPRGAAPGAMSPGAMSTMSPTMSPSPSAPASSDPPADPDERSRDPWDDECVPDPWAEEEHAARATDGTDRAIDRAIDLPEDPAG